MTGEAFDHELKYEMVMYQTKRMLRVGLITEKEYWEIDASFRAKYRPVSGGYIVETDLLCAKRRVIAYFKSTESEASSRIPKFLWNAKMRFGKTFAAYELAKKMGFKRVLVLTFKPAVESAWREDLVTHVDFEGWQFVSNKDAHDNSLNIDEQYAKADKKRPVVVFGSFQDLLGTNEFGGIKTKNEFIHTDNWDLVIFDEYHFGAWRDRAKKLFDNPDEEADTDFDAEKYQQEEAGNAVDETWLPITTRYYS